MTAPVILISAAVSLIGLTVGSAMSGNWLPAAAATACAIVISWRVA